MTILVISDTHGNYPLALKAVRLIEPIDVVLHLGDGGSDVEIMRSVLDVPIIAVAGNCDLGSGAPREYLWECEEKRILLVHGDAYHVKTGLERLERRAGDLGADAALYGHTHRALQETRSGVLFLNPGTLTPAGPVWSYAVLEVDRNTISAKIYDID